MAKKKKLTEKQRRFVDAYMGEASGNATDAAEIAGYEAKDRNSLGSIGVANLRKSFVQDALGARAAKDPLVATRDERQRFWTAVMRDPAGEMQSRLRASELLGKTQADFVERHEVVSTVHTDVTEMSRTELLEEYARLKIVHSKDQETE